MNSSQMDPMIHPIKLFMNSYWCTSYSSSWTLHRWIHWLTYFIRLFIMNSWIYFSQIDPLHELFTDGSTDLLTSYNSSWTPHRWIHWFTPSSSSWTLRMSLHTAIHELLDPLTYLLHQALHHHHQALHELFTDEFIDSLHTTLHELLTDGSID